MSLSTQITDYIRQHQYALINSVVVSKNGSIIAQNFYNNFTEASRNPIKSVAKSIMSIATGIALDRKLIPSIDEPIKTFIPEFNQNREMFHKRITLRHLLTMSSGIFWNGGRHYHCPMLEQMRLSSNWIDYIADCAIADMPGHVHNYKEWDVILLAKILDIVTGDMFDFINENLYKPLNIQSERWYKSKCGVYYSIGMTEEDESSSNLAATDMLKIGQLYLNDGIWNNNRIISSEYIKLSTSPSLQDPGYGLLWWITSDSYSCHGYSGQRISVFPATKTVVIVQASPSPRCKEYDDLVWFCAKNDN